MRPRNADDPTDNGDPKEKLEPINQEMAAERLKMQKEKMEEGTAKSAWEQKVNQVAGKILVEHHAPKAERESLYNNFLFMGVVFWLVKYGLNDEQIAIIVSKAVKDGVFQRTEESEGCERVSAALYALELEELELVTMEFVKDFTLSL